MADSVAEYLERLPPDQAAALVALRQRIHDLLPGLTEKISYQVPTFLYQGRGLVCVSAAKAHCSLHLMSPPLAERLSAAGKVPGLKGVTLQFQPDKPISNDLLVRILNERAAEVQALGPLKSKPKA
jgi:uncharacterized protein YdhG (YjbR/CyaY superfamily)